MYTKEHNIHIDEIKMKLLIFILVLKNRGLLVLLAAKLRSTATAKLLQDVRPLSAH